MERPEGIAWVSLHSSKIHAVRVPNSSHLWEGETFCGQKIGTDAISQSQSINDTDLCAKCEKSLYTYGYLLRISNRQLSIPGVFLSDVAHALEEKNIELTQANIESAATHVQLIASACAKAELQDLTREDWLDWIENFKVKS